ncbi:MAG: GRAM domain-containing protein [Limisphaerales bacterium]
MKILLKQDESILRKGAANLQVNIETVGGHLTLTTHRLIFKPHPLNIQRRITEIQLSDIRSVEECWTKFLGIFPAYPNSLAISTAQGSIFSFVLFNRQCWATAIKNASQSQA